MFTLTARGRRPGGRAAVGVTLLILWFSLLALPASAHDSLTDSDPGQGETLSEIPAELVLTFTGELSDLGVQFVVTGPEGRDVVQGTPTVEGVTVTQTLTEELTDGDYEAAWRVTSSDGHPISGTIEFTIAADTASRSDDRSGATGPSGAVDPNAATDGATQSGTTDPAESGADDPASTPTPTTPPTADGVGGGADEAETTADAAVGTSDASPSGGIPTWGWLVAALAAAGLVACGFLAFQRN